MRSSTRANEIGMVGVGETICARASRGHDGALLEDEHCPACAGERQKVGDRLHSLRVGDGMPPAIEDAESRAFLAGDPGEKAGALRPGAPDLEVRRAWTAE